MLKKEEKSVSWGADQTENTSMPIVYNPCLPDMYMV